MNQDQIYRLKDLKDVLHVQNSSNGPNEEVSKQLEELIQILLNQKKTEDIHRKSIVVKAKKDCPFFMNLISDYEFCSYRRQKCVGLAHMSCPLVGYEAILIEKAI